MPKNKTSFKKGHKINLGKRWKHKEIILRHITLNLGQNTQN